MLDLKKNRLSYVDMLRPPEGYELACALCTTYSLSLETLAGAVLALSFGESYESRLLQNPIYLLSAAEKVSGKLALFCQAGEIMPPKKAEPLAALLADSIVEVSLPKSAKGYPSFHPKVWLIKYENAAKQSQFRLIVLSRNLTFDNSLDVCFKAEGVQSRKKSNATALCDFIDFLCSLAPQSNISPEKAKMLKTMKKEVSSVYFTAKAPNGKPLEMELLASGIGRKSCDMLNDPLFNEPCRRIIAVSPFLAKSIVSKLSACAKDAQNKSAVLITRRDALAGITQRSCANLQPYVMKDAVLQYEQEGAVHGENSALADVHAKLYVKETGKGQSAKTEIYLGSMNATESGTSRNAELMVKLTDRSGAITADDVLSGLFLGDADGEQNPFEAAKAGGAEDPAANEADELRARIKEICRLQLKAKATPSQHGWSLSITIAGFEERKNEFIAPMLLNEDKPLKKSITFSGLSSTELSTFYRVTLKGESCEVRRVIAIPTDGLPEGFEKSVITHYLNDNNSLMRYISFVFSKSKLGAAADDEREDSSGLWRKNGGAASCVYETMLRAAIDDPWRFDICIKTVARLMDMLKERKMETMEFQKLYDAFIGAKSLRQRER